ncbi:hypothetical protein KEM52_001975, partial [Ascosphaera acerosa]
HDDAMVLKHSEHGDADTDMQDAPPKDATEEQLEKLLFGDDAGFHDALRDYDETAPDAESQDAQAQALALERRTARRGADGDADEDAESVDFEHLDDEDVSAHLSRMPTRVPANPSAQLFFLDSGVPPTDSSALSTTTNDAANSTPPTALTATRPAAWEDSDDERVAISLQAHQRLRKLRHTEAEDAITGAEYIQRLRGQYLTLHPVPKWAVAAARKAERRAARKTGGVLTSDAGSGDDEGVDGEGEEAAEEEDLSSQPLVRLLQNIGQAVQPPASSSSTGTAAKTRKLRPEVIDIVRLKDVPGTQPSAIESLSFHPQYPILLSSGPASTLFLHYISPDQTSSSSSSTSSSTAALLTSLHIRHTPIHSSAFLPPGGGQIIFSGRRRYFHAWELDSGRVRKVNGTADRRHEHRSMERLLPSPCGRWLALVGSTRKGGGVVSVLDARTAQWVAQVRVDARGGVADLAWWRDGNGLAVVGKNGEVSEWDLRLRRVVARWVDQGAVGTTVIALGGSVGGAAARLGGDRWVAVGSSSGIVNVYDRRAWQRPTAGGEEDGNAGVPSAPQPARVLDHLTTPTSHLCFSRDGQLLVMASRWKKDALRLGRSSLCHHTTTPHADKTNARRNVSCSPPPVVHGLPQLAHVKHPLRAHLRRGRLAQLGRACCRERGGQDPSVGDSEVTPLLFYIDKHIHIYTGGRDE